MEVVVSVGQSIDGIIQFSDDIPKNHTSCNIPVLAVEVNMNVEEQNRLDYEFYKKPTKNQKILLEDAALPAKQNCTILTEDCIRRLRNTKQELGEEVKHLNKFMLKMKNSGFSIKYRREILKSSCVSKWFRTGPYDIYIYKAAFHFLM